MVAQASRSVAPLSAALLDLDHFKHINDAHGHSRGDEVLAAVAAIALSNLDLRVTASLGVASLPDDCGDADSLLRAADRALYSAKGRGRNRVELFQSREDTAAPSMAVAANASSAPGQPAS